MTRQRSAQEVPAHVRAAGMSVPMTLETVQGSGSVPVGRPCPLWYELCLSLKKNKILHSINKHLLSTTVF